MKRTLAFFLLLAAVVPCSAQWKTASANDVVYVFGVHDTSLFLSSDAYVARYVPTAEPAGKWVEASNGIDFTQGDVTSFASLGRYFFAGMTIHGGPGTAWRSSDNGSHWTANAGGYVCSNGSYVFCVSDGIYRSKDSGNTGTWEKVTPFQASVLASLGAYIFASTPNGTWRSQDSGGVGTWSQISTPVTNLKTFAFIGSLTFAANGPIIRSTDSGSNWTQLSLTANTSRLASSGPYLFAGTDSGVYVSIDSGNTWRQENDGLGKYYQVNSLCVFDTLLFVNTALGFPYYTAMRPISEMVAEAKSVVQATPQPQDTLSIYPNPATGLVTIRSGGTAIERVSVLNVLGADVLEAGGSTFPRLEKAGDFYSLDLSQLPSGTYFLRIETAKESVLRKVVRE